MIIPMHSRRLDTVAEDRLKSADNIVSGGATGGEPKKHGPLLACFLLLAIATQSRADVIVQQPLEPTISGSFSNLGPAHQQTADNFQLPVVTTLESVSWFGRYSTALSVTNPVAFSIRFFADAGGRPAVSPLQELKVAVNAQATGLSFGAIPWFSYSTPVPALSLEAGTYWLSVVESDPQTPASGVSQWLWGNSNTSGVRATRSSDNAPWTARTFRDHALTLTGTPIPEPSALLLWGLGALGLVGHRWRCAGRGKRR